jgi:hypothetical protein
VSSHVTCFLPILYGKMLLFGPTVSPFASIMV